MPDFSLAEKWSDGLQETLILLAFEIKSHSCQWNTLQFVNDKLQQLSSILLRVKIKWCMMRPWDLASEGHTKFSGSTDLLDMDFIFMFRVTDFRNGDVIILMTLMILYPRVMVSVGWHLHNKCSLYL